MNQSLEPRGRSQKLKGVVVSDRMNKTRVIEVGRTIRHPLYHKRLRRQSRIFVHDESNESHMGDTILAVACRPLSRHKYFRIASIVEKKAGT